MDPAANRDEPGELFLADGRLRAVPAVLPPGTRRVDGRGLVALPGLIDVHVHFRDPGGTAAEDLVSGAAAAARGGFTRVVTMPNTLPPCDTPELVRRQREARLPVRILPSACLTRSRRGETVADLGALAAAGAVAFTDDGSMVPDDAVMAEAMRRARALGLPVLDHAMDPRLMGQAAIRASPLASRLGLPVLDPEAEVAAVRRDVRLARETGCALHVQHVSCAGSVVLIRDARREGLPVSAEASPHHLCLTAEEIVEDDGNLRMNPPLGSREDRRALREAVCDGTISVLATDHAPHAPETKSRGYARAPFGVIGLETAIGATHDALVRESGLSLLAWAAGWTVGPARLLGLPAPTLAADGRTADLTLVDFDTPFVVRPETFASKSRNCPFAGRTLRGCARLTVCEGRVTWYDPAWAGADVLKSCIS